MAENTQDMNGSGEASKVTLSVITSTCHPVEAMQNETAEHKNHKIASEIKPDDTDRQTGEVTNKNTSVSMDDPPQLDRSELCSASQEHSAGDSENLSQAQDTEGDSQKISIDGDATLSSSDVPLDEQSNLSEPQIPEQPAAAAATADPPRPPAPQSTAVNDESQSSVISEGQTVEVQQQCYCGKERNLNIVELQCAGCLKWFHESCIRIPLGKCVPFMTYYTFLCKSCNHSGIESFSKKQTNFSHMCATALANLMQRSIREGKPRTMFSKEKEVIPYIEKNWEHLTTMQRRIKHTWHTTVYKAVLKDPDIFRCEEKPSENDSSGEYPLFGLVLQDLCKIGPNYETLLRAGQTKQYQDPLLNQNVTGFAGGKGRSAKRKFPGDSQSASTGKKTKSDLTMPKLPPHGYPLEHPFNKDGYRYILAEPDPHAPFRQEFDESQDWAGKPIPGWLYRKLVPNAVFVAMHDRAPQLKISEDRLTITGEKGYCMIRATHGINSGTWYYECKIEDMPENSATRLGWSQDLGNLQAPLGYDRFSYSWRSRKGTKFHQSRGYHYSDGGYSQGDILGFLIHLPPTSDTIPLPQTYKDKPLVKFKSYLYFEEKDEIQLAIKNLQALPRSKMVYYKNGVNMGVAWTDIFGGTYYPALSMYKNCTVSLNFGPKFKYPPKEKFKGMYEAAHEALIEQVMSDTLYLVENEGKLRLDNFMI